ncbi:MAG: urease accessory protein UreF [Cyanobacteria bacterium J083]|nr:MAG: urease accessory protein UreF [Cyanobacteria bacterium J083]
MNEAKSLLRLLQLTNSSLPVGAYSYSEALEYLVEAKIITKADELQNWLEQEICYGAIATETAIMVRSYQNADNLIELKKWNNWLSAARETNELRQQSWQMGQALVRLLRTIQPETKNIFNSFDSPGNYAVVFGVCAYYWQIDLEIAVRGYLFSWLSNLINVGVKLIPLGQTIGQKLLLEVNNLLISCTPKIINLSDSELGSCSWGLALASMQHENQYSRLFRS